MKTYQVSIFLENKIGHFERVTQVLRDQEINIRAMTLTHTSSGWGILNLILSDPEKGCDALCEKGLSAALREIVVLEMDDHPGGLDDLLKLIAKAGVNFTNAYGRIASQHGKAYLVMDVEDIENARASIRNVGIEPLAGSEIYGNGLRKK